MELLIVSGLSGAGKSLSLIHIYFSLRARARQYAEIAYHVKPEYRMPAEQRDAL